jgi:FAD/FMN-containing dehydrogenase
MAGFGRRALLLGAGAVAGAAGARWLAPELPRIPDVGGLAPTGAAGTLNDASLLSETPVFRHDILPDPNPESALRALLTEAQGTGRPVNIGAARHSMGGQAIPRDGHAVTLAGTGDLIRPDPDTGTYTVQAGARWSQVIATLDPLGWSPLVMQSNNDFGVAATFSVGAHGWAVPQGPMGATVQAIRLMLADGQVVTASRTENADLFRAAMGGYGLIGLILDLTVRMVPNRRLLPTFTRMPAEEFASAFIATVRDPAVNMAYGRLNVDLDNFLTEALMIHYTEDPDQTALPAAEGSGMLAHLASYLYRAQLGNEPMRGLRWGLEAGLNPRMSGGPVTRNSLINEPVITLDDRDDRRVDILHEYFVDPDRFGDFLTACRQIIPASYQEFLNVTLRFVDTDPDAMLAYAPRPRIAAVMSFSQEMTLRAEADMARMTTALIEAVLAIGGSYYLPYRPHATVDQFARCYPGHRDLIGLKRQVDPDTRFRNNLWDTYLRPLT